MVTLPLILLAIPSILIGFFTVGPDAVRHRLARPRQAAAVLPRRDRRADARATWSAALAKEFHGPVAFALHGFTAPAFWLAFAGFVLATVMYWWKPELPAQGAQVVRRWPVRVLENKYGFDDLWIGGFAGGGLGLGKASRAIDTQVIDGAAVNGSARAVDLAAQPGAPACSPATSTTTPSR